MVYFPQHFSCRYSDSDGRMCSLKFSSFICLEGAESQFSSLEKETTDFQAFWDSNTPHVSCWNYAWKEFNTYWLLSKEAILFPCLSPKWFSFWMYQYLQLWTEEVSDTQQLPWCTYRFTATELAAEQSRCRLISEQSKCADEAGLCSTISVNIIK